MAITMLMTLIGAFIDFWVMIGNVLAKFIDVFQGLFHLFH